VEQCLAEHAAELEDAESDADADSDAENDCDIEALKESQKQELAAIDELKLTRKETTERKKTLRADYKERIAECRERKKFRKTAKRQKHAEKREGLYGCLTEKAKTRRVLWRDSQQKSAKKCFGKAYYGKPPKFGTIASLKKLAETRRSNAARMPTTDYSSLQVTRGSLESPPRSLSPNRARYVAPVGAKKPKRTRKVKNHSGLNRDKE
jgi:hypothetical protein